MFYHEVSNGNTMSKILYSERFTGFNKVAYERLADHQNKTGTIHQKNIPISGTSVEIMKGRILAIKEQVKLKLDQLIFNQIVLKSVIETIIFCGCKTLSLTR